MKIAATLLLLASVVSENALAQGATIEATPPGTAPAGSTVTVKWSGPNGRGDYITVVRKGAAPSEYLDYRLTSDGRAPVNPVSIVMPAEPGVYEIRYVSNTPRSVLATVAYEVTAVAATIEGPASVASNARFEVAWLGPNNGGDWVTIVALGAAMRAYGSYVDARIGRADDKSGRRVATLRAPTTPGRYELRYVQQGTRVIGTRAIEVTTSTSVSSSTAATTTQTTVVPLIPIATLAPQQPSTPSSTSEVLLNPGLRSTLPATGGGGLKVVPTTSGSTSSATTMATRLDLNIFGTEVVQLPVPLTPTPAAGSYQASCINLSQRQFIRLGTPWRRTTLSAQCRTGGGTWLPAQLHDPHLCSGDIRNDNGRLRCARVQGTALPAGTWSQSCLDPYHEPQSKEFRAVCLTRSLTWHDASLNSTYPCASVSNDDGWLSCDTAPLPRGPWRAHCEDASLPLQGVGFAAICRRDSDGVRMRTMLGPCSTDVDVLDGYLTCGLIEGLPTGDWSTRCRPVNWDANEPAISLICRNNDQTVVGWRFSFSGCPVPLFLNYDGNDKFNCVPPPVIRAGGE